MDDLVDIQRECYDDSLNWFGEEIVQNLPHQALAMAGEVGELCNIVKKLQRGDRTLDEDTLQELANEVVDVFIYTVNIANILKMNLGNAYDYKREYNAGRFTRDDCGARTAPSPSNGVSPEVPGETGDGG